MTTQPDIDAIAREAAHSHVIGTPLQPVIIAAIRRALEPVERRLTAAVAIRRLQSGPKTLEAKWLDPACWDGCKSLVLKKQLSEAISERDALVKISEAADQLEALLSRNCGSNDDWPISLKVSGDYAQELAGKLTALTRALKPYREKIK